MAETVGIIRDRRSLFKYKPRVSDKSKIDIPDTKSYRNIAKLRLGCNILKDYQHKIGNTDSNLCTCGEIETAEHYILSCEQYFNERETMRTNIFNISGISDLNCDLLLGCSKSTYGIAILHAMSKFLTQTSRFYRAPRTRKIPCDNY